MNVRFAVVGLVVGVAAAQAVELVPHRAVYRIVLGTAEAGSGIVSAEGAMAYRFADVCDGWTVENQTLVRFVYDETNETETTWALVAWESHDGRRYRFRVSQTRDGQPAESYQGTARVEADGRGVARFTRPREADVPLPAGTMFPTRHLVELLETALKTERGVGQALRTVFDGTSLDNPYEINAVINRVPAGAAAETDRFGLKPLPMWQMRLAFFPIGTQGQLPEFEIDIRYRQDGIADRLKQDFGDVVLDLTLTDLELLPKPDC